MRALVSCSERMNRDVNMCQKELEFQFTFFTAVKVIVSIRQSIQPGIKQVLCIIRLYACSYLLFLIMFLMFSCMYLLGFLQ